MEANRTVEMPNPPPNPRPSPPPERTSLRCASAAVDIADTSRTAAEIRPIVRVKRDMIDPFCSAGDMNLKCNGGAHKPP
jgi:hypothetical protein